jgi:RNA-directed DNA polymerase
VAKVAEALKREAEKLVLRQERYARWVFDENVRRQRRVSTPLAPLQVLRPEYWDWAPGFDPYVVRARSASIAHAISRSLKEGSYQPRSPAGYRVPKVGDGDRLVSVFQVADNAVSTMVFKSLMAKNRGKISGRSYAYRSDLTAHDALQYVQAEFGRTRRLFVAEYDFSKYFDSIDHEHIRRTLRDERFLLTHAEKTVVEAFLRSPLPAEHGYEEHDGEERLHGVPQGTSISLFLANLAAAPLDRELERQGVSFVRYADDTLLWSTDYAALGRSVDLLHAIANDIGAEINLKKSEGINLLVPDGADGELRFKHSVDFVGYRVSLDQLEMKTASADRIKRRLRDLMYENLLKSVVNGTIDPARLAGKVALRDQAWLMASDSCGSVSLPCDAAASEEETESVVLHVAEAVADAADLLDEQVDRFGGAVRCPAGRVVGEDLVLPRGDGAGEAFELGDLAVGAVDVEVVEPPTRDAWVAGSVEVAESFFGDERVGDFTVGVTRGEAGHEPIEAALSEPPTAA